MTAPSSYVYFDFCFYELCNLTCSYCRTSNDGYARDIPPEQFHGIVDRFLAERRAAIFKVSGYGEVSLWPHLAECLGRYQGQFPVLQVMTNGTMPATVFRSLLSLPNLVFCMTLDGHEPAMNAHRTGGNGHLHERMLAFARRVVAANRRLEINCVVTAANVDGLPAFARFIRDELGPAAMLMPFPMRPFAGLDSAATMASAADAERTLAALAQLEHECGAVLPPLPYLRRVFQTIAWGERRRACYVPALNYAVGPDLQARACACLGHTRPSDDVDNRLYRLGRSDARTREDQARIAQAMKGHVDERCRDCLTHYDVVNALLDGEIAWNELARVPSFSLPGVAPIVGEIAALLAPHVGGPRSPAALTAGVA